MRRILLSFAFVLLVTAGTAWAQLGDFHHRPCLNWPWGNEPYYNSWVTPFPYQRNIIYDFDNVDDVYKPNYFGYDDPLLWLSDFVETSNISHWEIDPVFGIRAGVVGIDNRQGIEPVQGFIQFRIDNWDNKNPWKHIWKEVEFTLSRAIVGGPAGAILTENVTVPEPSLFFLVDPTIVEDLDDNYTREDVAWKVIDNPPYEDIYLILDVPAGGYAFIDQVHFATECVPEPGMLALVGTGGITMLGLFRRRRTK